MSSTKIGYFAGIGYIVTTLFSMFYVETVISHLQNKFVALFIACTISAIFFTIINIRKMDKVFLSVINSWRLYLLLSLLIGANWLCSIFGVINGNAFLYALGYFLFSASLAHFNNFISTKNKQSYYLCIASWVVIMIAFAINEKFYLGLLIALLGGATGYCYRRITFSFSSKENLSPSQIISVRFYPLIILLPSKFTFPDFSKIMQHHLLLILIFSIVSFIIPNYLNQVAIIKIGANKSTILAALLFPASWFIEEGMHHTVMINANFILAVCSMLIILTPFLMKKISRDPVYAN